MRWFLAIILGVVVFLATFLFFRLGVYKSAKLHGVQTREFNILFVDHVGPYHTINEDIRKVESWAFQNNIDCKLTFGEYIDDPREMDEGRLRSRAGCVLTAKPEITLLPEGFQFEARPATEYLFLDFNGSPSVSPYKVYPKAFDWVSDNKRTLAGPIIEVYRVTENESLITEYYFPLK